MRRYQFFTMELFHERLLVILYKTCFHVCFQKLEELFKWSFTPEFCYHFFDVEVSQYRQRHFNYWIQSRSFSQLQCDFFRRDICVMVSVTVKLDEAFISRISPSHERSVILELRDPAMNCSVGELVVQNGDDNGFSERVPLEIFPREPEAVVQSQEIPLKPIKPDDVDQSVPEAPVPASSSLQNTRKRQGKCMRKVDDDENTSMDDDASVVEICSASSQSSSSSDEDDEHAQFSWQLQGVSLWNNETSIMSGGVNGRAYKIIHGISFEMSLEVTDVVNLYLHANRLPHSGKTSRFSCQVQYKIVLNRKLETGKCQGKCKCFHGRNVRKLPGKNPTTGWKSVNFTDNLSMIGGEFMSLEVFKETKGCVAYNAVQFTCVLHVEVPIIST